MSETVTFNTETINKGADMLADGRLSTQWEFFGMVADAIPATLEGVALTAVVETLRNKVAAKRFGKATVTADDLRRSKLASVNTIKDRVKDIRPTRGHDMGDLVSTVALEAYGHVYRSPNGSKDLDKTAAAIAAYTAKHGTAPSVRAAREGFGRTAKVVTGEASDGGPMTVGDHVEWLISQPAAVAAYVAEFPEVAATLAAMLAPNAAEVAA